MIFLKKSVIAAVAAVYDLLPELTSMWSLLGENPKLGTVRVVAVVEAVLQFLRCFLIS